ncbi:hypothetical protein [Rhodopirellula halodulae]|uniref:hypothetical protein n=1 Tax=Rhodopirellula halodulae TaxID=2894198 RepID=UPI001E633298|nr:hypothetical protein [Rhodopirellula sp. JC737]
MDQQSLQRAIRQDKVERARQMSLDDRLAAGARLYAEQLARTRDLLHGMHPEWSMEDVDAEMKRRRRVLSDRDSKRFFRQDPSRDSAVADAT